MLKFNITNEASQKIILRIFQDICWIIEPELEGNIEYLFPCLYEHTFKVLGDEAGKMQFYVSYYESHNPNKKYQIKQVTAKTYRDQQYVEGMISILLSDKSLNAISYNNNYELYVTRANRDYYHVSIYPALEVFEVEDAKDNVGYNEWQKALSRPGPFTL